MSSMNFICKANTEGHCSFDCYDCLYETKETKKKFQVLYSKSKSK